MSTPTTTSQIPLHYYANTGAALGCFITGINIYGAIRPRTTLSQLGFPLPIAPTDRTLVDGLVRMLCGTRIALGAGLLAMWYHGNYKALGLSSIAGSVMAVMDGFVSRSVIGKGEWMHWGALPVGLLVGVGLLGWL